MNSTELKEAIAEYIKSKELVLMGYSPEYIDDVKTDMEIAFRAGAEWMAEQEQPEADLEEEAYMHGFTQGAKEERKDLTPLINRLCEAILFEWKDAADLARKTLTQIKAREEE